MAIGMQEHTVFSAVVTAVHAPHNVVVMPASEFRDLLLADRADSVLLPPEVKQGPFSLSLASAKK
jgi:hypothetical protein